MTDSMKGLAYTLTVLGMGFAAGVGLGYRLYHAEPVVSKDVAHAEVKLPGGGVIVAEKPTEDPLAVPQGLPQTTVVVRRVEVLVQPDKPLEPAVPIVTGHYFPSDPKPVKVILSLIRQQDSTLRVVATAEGGTIIGALDIPNLAQPVVAAAPVSRDMRWSVEAEHTTYFNQGVSPAWGAAIHYARGPFVGGIGGNRHEVRASLGVRF
jgi:hypothetical protein